MMKSKSLLRIVLVVLASAALAMAVRAESLVTEVLTIGYRSAHELLPIIEPFVPPPGVIVGFQNQLVIKTTPANLEEIRGLLASLDRAPANLLISVRHTIDDEVRRDLAEGFANVNAGDVQVIVGGQSSGVGLVVQGASGGSSAGVKVQSTHSSGYDRDVQRVRVLEGHEAFIQTGQSVPSAEQQVVVTGSTVTTVQSVQYRNVTKGFYVRPRLAGEQVTLQISPHRDTLSASGGGSIDTRSATTVVSARLGQWVEIGGVGEQHTRSSTGVAASTSSSGSSQYSIYIRVDRLN